MNRLDELIEKESPSKRRYLACALRWLREHGFEIVDPPPTKPTTENP